MSSGTRSPARRIVRSAPMAISSEWAMTPVGGAGERQERAHGLRPGRGAPAHACEQVGVEGERGPLEGVEIGTGPAVDRPLVGVGVDRVDHGDAAVAEVEKVVHRLGAGRVVVDAHVRVRRDLPAGRDDVHAHQPESVLLDLVDGDADHEQAVDLAARGQLPEERLAVLTLADAVEHHVEMGRAEHGLDALEHLAEEPPGQVRDDDCHPPRGAARERRSGRGDDVARAPGRPRGPARGWLGRLQEGR